MSAALRPSGKPPGRPLRPSDPSRIDVYRLQRRLSGGGPGVQVYLARSPGGAMVTVRTIGGHWACDPGFRTRFTRETAAARAVRHPFIVPVIAADALAATHPGCLWLASPYLPEPSLTTVVQRNGALPRRSVQALGAMLADALATVHRAEMIHGDVAPDKVLLTGDGPRLTGLGIGGAQQEMALAGGGTEGDAGATCYLLSPERAAADPPGPGPAADIFALGCVLAYASSGRPPFRSGSTETVRNRLRFDAADLADVPRSLLEVVQACLARAPEVRPTAAELHRELTTGAEGDGWLPDPFARTVRDHAEERADTPGPVAPPPPSVASAAGAGASGAEASPARSGGRGRSRHRAPVPTRRRLLTAASAGGLFLVGGLTAWLASRSGADADPGGGRSWVLGLHADLSGPGARHGRAQQLGAELAVTEYTVVENPPFDVVLRVVDDSGDPARAAAVAAELAADPAVAAVIGPSAESSAERAAVVYEDERLPFVSLSVGSFSDENSDREYHSLLQARPPTAWQGFALQIYLEEELEARRIGLIDDRTAETYSWELTRALTGALDRDRVGLVPRVVPRGTEDFAPVVAHFMDRGVDTVVYGGHAKGAARLARALRRHGFDGTCLAGDAVLSPEFLDGAGGAGEGWLLIAPFTDPAADPRVAGFTSVFRERFDEAPGPYAAEAYDAARMLLEAVRGMIEDGGTPDLRPGLPGRLKEDSHRGVAKELAFDPAGRYAHGGDGLYLYRVEGGTFRFLGRAPSLAD
ncbi:hypothetical protein GCM10009716_27300 [Streptomyces sodiiphilus]|uniref:Protein kinase domain-containing protein n=1 Tax=Streptomyces sodiiphilus TaxID=226217 RepID=A0ABN2PBM0_9ACTN